MQQFNAEIEIIGINPFVFVPKNILQVIFEQAGKDKGHIPICGLVNGKPYQQTLLRYSGEWRFYINTTMLKNSPRRIGEIIDLTIQYDSEPRTVETPTFFLEALAVNKDAEAVFYGLSTSKQGEIVRYLLNLKTEVALEKNIKRAINFLIGKERFLGRDKP